MEIASFFEIQLSKQTDNLRITTVSQLETAEA